MTPFGLVVWTMNVWLLDKQIKLVYDKLNRENGENERNVIFNTKIYIEHNYVVYFFQQN